MSSRRDLPNLASVAGAIDSEQLRTQGVQSYGVGTVTSDRHSARVHGNDERVSLEGLGRFLEFVYRAVIEGAATKP